MRSGRVHNMFLVFVLVASLLCTQTLDAVCGCWHACYRDSECNLAIASRRSAELVKVTVQDELGATVHNAVHASGETCTDEARVA